MISRIQKILFVLLLSTGCTQTHHTVGSSPYTPTVTPGVDVTAAGTVTSINNGTVPKAVTTGQFLEVTGTNLWDAGPINLANAASVTGVLPIANQAAQTLTGNVTGNTGASVVSGITGVSPIPITPNNLQFVAAAVPTISQAYTTTPTGSNLLVHSQDTDAGAGTNVTLQYGATVAPVLTNTAGVTINNSYGELALLTTLYGQEASDSYFAIYPGQHAKTTAYYMLYFDTAGNGIALNSQTGTSLNVAGAVIANATSTGLAVTGALSSTTTLTLSGALVLNSPQTISCSTGGSFNVAATPTPGIIVTSGTLSSNCTIAFATNASTGLYTLDMSGVTLGTSFGVVFTNGTATKTYLSSSVLSGTLATVWTHGANTLAVNF